MKKAFLIIAITLLGAALPVSANQGIVALVNDEVISHYDLEQRLKLFYINANIEAPQDASQRAQLEERILNDLIDELLKAQEAKRRGIRAGANEIIQALNRVAQRNNLDLSGLERFMISRGVSVSTLYLQAENQLLWERYVQRALGSRVAVGQVEIQERLALLRREAQEPRYLLQELQLPYAYEVSREQVLNIANRLVGELRRGADFNNVAQQFSFAPSAARGGDIGWLALSQTKPELQETIKSMRVGDIAGPISTKEDGVYILNLRSKERYGEPNPLRHQFTLFRINITAPDNAPVRTTPAPAQNRIVWRNLFPRLRTKAPAEEFQSNTLNRSQTAMLDERLEQFVANYTDCASIPALAQALGITEYNAIGDVALGALGHSYQDLIANLKTGDLSAPLRHSQSYELLAVCNRQDDTGVALSAQIAQRQIYSERLQLAVTQKMRELRRRATIENRLAR